MCGFEFHSRAKQVCAKMNCPLFPVQGGLHRNCAGPIHLCHGSEGVVEGGA